MSKNLNVNKRDAMFSLIMETLLLSSIIGQKKQEAVWGPQYALGLLYWPIDQNNDVVWPFYYRALIMHHYAHIDEK